MTEPTIAEVRSLTDRYTRTVLAEPTGWSATSRRPRIAPRR